MLDRRHHVLVAEGDPDMREIVSDYLTHKGYEPIAAADGHEALALAIQLKDHQPELAVILIAGSDPRKDGCAVGW